ncbi:MAG: helix-turn-helix domain-containing protein [Erysipelotrichaceae bacterium]|nr:helix-turn-helix domain-containing protein [Erysipelotrichaceae bacterium]
MIELVQYEKEFNDLAHVIYDVFGIEMIVIDRYLYIIVNTFDYRDDPIDVKLNSIIGSIIVSGKPRLIRNRQESSACLTCQDYERCTMEGVIGVPIIFQDNCLGAIAVLVRKANQHLFDEANKIFTILSKFSEIFVRSLEIEKARDAVKELSTLTTDLINGIDEPVVFLKRDDVVTSANNAFLDLFGFSMEECVDKGFQELIVNKMLNNDREMRAGAFFTGRDNRIVQIRSIREQTSDLWNVERIVYFKTVEAEPDHEDFKSFKAETRMERFWGPSKAMREAKENTLKSLKNSLSVLIEGPSVSQNRELMRIISRYGEVKNVPQIIECSTDHKELERLLFGDRNTIPGILWPSPRESICLASIDHMPLYIQKSIVDVILTQRADNSVIKKMKIFATSNRSLSELTGRGLFLSDFLEFIKQNYIVIPDIKNSPEDREYYLRTYIEDYGQIYGKNRIDISPDFLSSFLCDSSLDSLQRINKAAEFFVLNCSGDLLDIKNWYRWQKGNRKTDENNVSLEQIGILIDAGFSKKKIAEKLGISRATLYRRLNELEEVSE